VYHLHLCHVAIVARVSLHICHEIALVYPLHQCHVLRKTKKKGSCNVRGIGQAAQICGRLALGVATRSVLYVLTTQSHYPAPYANWHTVCYLRMINHLKLAGPLHREKGYRLDVNSLYYWVLITHVTLLPPWLNPSSDCHGSLSRLQARLVRRGVNALKSCAPAVFSQPRNCWNF
jgi:hypothetical protein